MPVPKQWQLLLRRQNKSPRIPNGSFSDRKGIPISIIPANAYPPSQCSDAERNTFGSSTLLPTHLACSCPESLPLQHLRIDCHSLNPNDNPFLPILPVYRYQNWVLTTLRMSSFSSSTLVRLKLPATIRFLPGRLLFLK